jgi:hypothetical protein
MVGSSFVDLDINRQTRRKLTEASSMIVDTRDQAKRWRCVRVREKNEETMGDVLNRLSAEGFEIFTVDFEHAWVVAFKEHDHEKAEY